MLWPLVLAGCICCCCAGRRRRLRLSQAVPESPPAKILAATTVPLTDYFRESWTTRDGLPHNTINGIIQSRMVICGLPPGRGQPAMMAAIFAVYGRNDIPGMPDSGMRALYIDYDGQLLIGGSRGGVAGIITVNGRRCQLLAP